MILPIIVVVVLVIAGGIAFVVKSKGSRSSGEFLAADPARPTTAVDPTRPVASPSDREAPVAAADRAVEPAAEPDLERLVFAEPADTDPVTAAEPAAPAPIRVDPVAPDERPEPMVRARLTPTAPVPEPEPAVDEDDDQAVLSRFTAPGARVASIPIPQPAETGPDVSTEAELDDLVLADDAAEPDDIVAVVEPEPVAMPEPEPVAIEEPEPVDLVEPEPVSIPEPVADAEPEPVAVAEAEPVAEAEAEPEPEPVALVEPEPEPVVSLDADVDLDADPVTVATAEVPPALTGAAAMSPVLDDPIVLVDEPVLPVAQLQPEPELDPVDHVLKALIHRAKEKQVGIAEVAAELVEQANLEDRDIDEVLADLVVRADDDTVDSSERLEELTLFNDSVPRRPGQLTDFDRLDKNARKKVIIRVLCLLVAMQEDNRLKPSEPRSEAETRHWPLARAVWPVPVAVDDEADDAEGDKKQLPGRRLARTSTKR